MRAIIAAVVVIVATLLVAAPVAAHGVRTGALRVDEVSATRALVRWSLPVPSATARVRFPSACTATTNEELSGGSAVYALECPDGLAGRTFGVAGLGTLLNEATLFVRFADGREASRLLTPDAPDWTLPRVESAAEVARSYVLAGLRHIATGVDHILFLALLVLVLRRARAVVLAETAFTASHSLAFAATSLGFVHLRPAPVEACIALSLVLLALDVRRVPEARPAWHGPTVAFVFGLVHGLGFAGGLRETGLPDRHAALALVGFGAGVEIGQLAILGLVFVVVAASSRLRAFPPLVDAAAVGSGGIAMFWLIERVLQCFSG